MSRGHHQGPARRREYKYTGGYAFLSFSHSATGRFTFLLFIALQRGEQFLPVVESETTHGTFNCAAGSRILIVRLDEEMLLAFASLFQVVAKFIILMTFKYN